jgi:hypothetical protein
MKIPLIALATTALCLLANPAAHSQESNHKPKHYCGSGITQMAVPDKFVGCDFAEACRLHDECYSKCEPGNSRFDRIYCGMSEFSTARILAKAKCDNALEQGIKQKNKDNPLCGVLAGFYGLAVKVLGQGPFNGREVQEALTLYEKIYDTSPSEETASVKFQGLYQLREGGYIDISEVQFEQNQLTVPTTRRIGSVLAHDGNTVVIPNNYRPGQINKIVRGAISQQ